MATDAEERDEPTPAALAARLPHADLPAVHHPTLLAWRKARAAAAAAPGCVVLGADTTVVLAGEVLNKPRDAAHAHAMLRQLSGQTHIVYTGLCVIGPAAQLLLDLVATEVEFFALDDPTIAAYVASGDPLDKAGSYGLQGPGGEFVRAVRGSYTNVVGLPLDATHRLLNAAGVHALHDPAATYERWLQSQGKEPPPCPPTLP